MGSRKRTVICGGGAFGAAIAYFLSRRGARPIFIERHEVAGAIRQVGRLFWRSIGDAAARSMDWRGEVSSSMPNFPPSSAILGDIGG